jgi:hypothetical protein
VYRLLSAVLRPILDDEGQPDRNPGIYRLAKSSAFERPSPGANRMRPNSTCGRSVLHALETNHLGAGLSTDRPPDYRGRTPCPPRRCC